MEAMLMENQRVPGGWVFEVTLTTGQQRVYHVRLASESTEDEARYQVLLRLDADKVQPMAIVSLPWMVEDDVDVGQLQGDQL
jgi:homoaconitase/3-isopropylmalate dehydratase large subunit